MASAPIRLLSLERLPVLSADPSGTFTGGEHYFNSTINAVKVYNASAWVPLLPRETVRWSLAGAVSVANGALRLPIQYACTVVAINAIINTPPAGAAVNIRVNKNGSSAATLSISAAANTGSNTSPGITLASGDYLTVDLTQVGSTTAGSDLVVSMLLQQA